MYLPPITHDSYYHRLNNTTRMRASLQKSFLIQRMGHGKFRGRDLAKHSPPEIHKEEYALGSCIWWASFMRKEILGSGKRCGMTLQSKEWRCPASLCAGSAGFQTKSTGLVLLLFACSLSTLSAKNSIWMDLKSLTCRGFFIMHPRANWFQVRREVIISYK